MTTAKKRSQHIFQNTWIFYQTRTVVLILKIILNYQLNGQFVPTGEVKNMATGFIKSTGFPMIIRLVSCEDCKLQDVLILTAKKGTPSIHFQKCVQTFQKSVMIPLF
jgi:hypothetical protein